MWFKVLLTSCALLVVFQLSNAAYDLQFCYECEYFEGASDAEGLGKNDKRCKENPPPEEFYVNCTEYTENTDTTTWQCIKVTGRIEIDDENKNYIRRACSPGKTYDSCKDCKNTKTYETQYGFVKRGKVCVCDEDDGCNTGNGLSFSVLTVVGGIMFAVFSKF